MPYRTRRTIKPASMDAARPVEKSVLAEILTDAHWAPSHGMTQPWRFHVFAGAARQRLADGLLSIYDRLVPPAARNEEKRAKLSALALRSPVVIAVAARVEPGGKIPEPEEIAATCCAVQNLMLSAHGHGLGSFWATPPVTRSAEFAAWLGLDDTHRMLGVVALGYPLPGKIPPPPPRHPLEQHVVWHDE
ncbi:nitroreductase [Opitutaceae bacterium TAV5]|nr:nitroreductase [Opitutaceae bacterium TAV5]